MCDEISDEEIINTFSLIFLPKQKQEGKRAAQASNPFCSEKR
jgi:hypothetical protein